MIRILIVDSDIDQCRGLSELLSLFDFDCAAAVNNIDALRILAESDPLPKIILLNPNLPEMGSWKFLEALNYNKAYAKIPVMTMVADDVVHCGPLQFAQLLSKAFN